MLSPGRILTYSGNLFSPLDPQPKDVHIEDIAHSLSLLCRFTGHARVFYSVAQHSIQVSLRVPPKYALWGLLHDATEAYLNDISLPLKVLPEYSEYRDAEKRLSQVIMTRFGLDPEEPEPVKVADKLMCRIEGCVLMNGWQDVPTQSFYWEAPMGPEAAEKDFLRRFKELT
jgi:hypothetical protein